MPSLFRYWELADSIREDPEKFLSTSKEAWDFVSACAQQDQPFKKQLEALSSEADILMVGGGVSSGKTTLAMALILAHQFKHPRSECVVFRESYKEVKQPGGIWDRLSSMAIDFGREDYLNKSELTLEWANNSRVTCSYLSDRNSTKRWSGSEVDLFILDEVQNLDEWCVEFVQTRNRNKYGHPNRTLWTCNPAPKTWLSRFIQWWWDPETGYPIEERSGVIRWFTRDGSMVKWFDSKEEGIAWVEESGMIQVSEDHPEYETLLNNSVMSFTFIPSTLIDNPHAIRANPKYYGTIMSRPPEERMALLYGNWKEVQGDGTVFSRQSFKVRGELDGTPELTIVAMDTAAKAKQRNDYTAWIRMHLHRGIIYVEDGDQTKVEFPALKRLANKLSRTADALVVEDASSGIQLCQVLRDEGIRAIPYKIPTGDLRERAMKVSVFCEDGWVVLPKGEFGEVLLNELTRFDGDTKNHDDLVSAFVIGVRYLFDKGHSRGGVQQSPTVAPERDDKYLGNINYVASDTMSVLESMGLETFGF